MIFIACKKEDCDNYDAPYFVNEKATPLAPVPCPLCGESMEEIPNPEEGQLA